MKALSIWQPYASLIAINGNMIYDGVETDKNGKIVAYHIRNTYPFEQTTKETKWVRVVAYGEETGLPNVLHIMQAERPEQYRGVTYLAQVIEPLLQLRRYTDSELTAAVVESFFTAFIKTESDPSAFPFNEVGDGEVQDGTTGESEQGISTDENEYEMGPGQINVMKPGEDVVFGDPKRPAGGFDAFVQAICKQVGAALEIPADLLLKAFNASYSASRAALLEAWKAFKMWREWFVDDFCRPLYEVWLSEAVARSVVFSLPASSSIPLSEPRGSVPNGSARRRDSSIPSKRSKPKPLPARMDSAHANSRPSNLTAAVTRATSSSLPTKTLNFQRQKEKASRAIHSMRLPRRLFLKS